MKYDSVFDVLQEHHSLPISFHYFQHDNDMQFAILAAISVVSRLMMTVHICLILSNAINYTLKINQVEIDQVSYERHEIHITHKMRNI